MTQNEKVDEEFVKGNYEIFVRGEHFSNPIIGFLVKDLFEKKIDDIFYNNYNIIFRSSLLDNVNSFKIKDIIEFFFAEEFFVVSFRNGRWYCLYDDIDDVWIEAYDKTYQSSFD